MLFLLTTDEVEGESLSVGADVEAAGVLFLLETSHQLLAALHEHLEEALQDVEVEGGRDQLAMHVPTSAW